MKTLSDADFKQLKELFDLAEEGFHYTENYLVSVKEYVLDLTNKNPDMLAVKAGHIVCDLVKKELSDLYAKRKERRNNWLDVKNQYTAQKEGKV